MGLKRWIYVGILLLGLLGSGIIHGQTIPAGFPILEEYARKESLLGNEWKENSFALRPIRIPNGWGKERNYEVDTSRASFPRRIRAEILPWLNTTIYNHKRPFGWGNSSLFNAAGFQNLNSPGFFFKFFLLEIQLRPEFVYSQNPDFQGYGGQFSDNTNFSRFRFWNFGDHPEYFGEEYRQFATWGQSYISLNFGKIETGLSSQNVWWGPGQFSSLIFSNNARGFNHLFLRTSKPINIGIGHLEGEILAGRAEDSGLDPSQNPILNQQYFWKFSGDWRYVTGITLTYQPKFLRNFFVGFNRTFQQYSQDVENTFTGRLPIFEAFQKEKFFESGNSVIYDALAQDQQASVFFKYRSTQGKFEMYSEFGKHDHNFNWREFMLNPEHARSFLMGFSKLISLPKPEEYLQVRAELIHQSESVNRYIRYPVLGVSNTSWHTHYQVRGFSNYGESMGAGIGVGANAQILEVSKIKNLDKIGITLQRIENHQDFFYRAFEDDPTQSPWIDLSLGVIWNKQWKNLVFSATGQMIQGKNYQWQSIQNPSPDFYSGNDKLSFSGQLHLLYLFR